MSEGPFRRPARSSSKPPRVRFNWPPTEDELAEYGAEGPQRGPELAEAGLEAGESVAGDVSPATATIDLFPSETSAQPLQALPQDASSSPVAAAVDSSGTDDFADEIALLQALIEELTQKIEWRIPDVTAH
jgi:hypothetical protein